MSEPSIPEPPGPDFERAEAILTQASATVTTWMNRLSTEVLKRAALAREEAEDIWAEAQARHRGDEI